MENGKRCYPNAAGGRAAGSADAGTFPPAGQRRTAGGGAHGGNHGRRAAAAPYLPHPYAATRPSARTAPREPESCLEKKEKAGGLGGLFQDQEQLFLLMLAVLLIKNGAQMEIVLALLYIAM